MFRKSFQKAQKSYQKGLYGIKYLWPIEDFIVNTCIQRNFKFTIGNSQKKKKLKEICPHYIQGNVVKH